MSGVKFFVRHYRNLVLVILFFGLAGLIVSRILIYAADSARPVPGPPVFFARLIDQIKAESRLSALEKMEKINKNELPYKFSLLNSSGVVIFPESTNQDQQVRFLKLPTKAYEFLSLDDHAPKNNLDFLIKSITFSSPPPKYAGVIKFEGAPAQYLVIQDRFAPAKPSIRLFLVSSALTLFSILIGVGFALYAVYRALNKRVVVADQVISELQKGNLKARFPIHKHDEFRSAMIRFNHMASEIEHLVDRLKQTEQSRMALLQELAHDLRTPIASLKNLLETLTYKKEHLSKEVQSEITELSMKEILYFEKLVEDLLVLAQVSEPRYHVKSGTVNLAELLADEAQDSQTRNAFNGQKIRLSVNFPNEQIVIQGESLLLHRLFKNALDNAFSFATSEVKIDLKYLDDAILVSIYNDGEGFTPEALESFGNRKISRKLGSLKSNGRISVGLGSVIMKTIVEAHRGSMMVKNENGSKIEFILPLQQRHPQLALEFFRLKRPQSTDSTSATPNLDQF